MAAARAHGTRAFEAKHATGAMGVHATMATTRMCAPRASASKPRGVRRRKASERSMSARPSTRMTSTRASPSSTTDADADARVATKKKEKPPIKPTSELIANLWGELKYVSPRDDPLPEAVDLVATIEASKALPGPGERWTDAQWERQEAAAAEVAGKIGKYWNAKWDNLANSDAVKEAAPLLSSAVNVAIAGVLIRLALPRVAALQAVGGFDDLTEFFGLPPRDELKGYLDQLQGLNTAVVFAVYVGLFAAEKLTMTDEFLPIGFILPVVSPVVFGGVFGGTMMTSLASTMAASLNFWLGRTVFKEKALALKWKDNPAVGESKWFNALSRRFDSREFPESEFPFTEGFKSALLLRLCPILPIPLSGNWYVCWMTPLRLPEFFAAHFIGSSKTAFIDAYLGSLLFQAAFEADSLKDQAQTALVFETGALVLISIGVTTYATDLFTQILEEEGIDASNMMSEDDDDDEREPPEEKMGEGEFTKVLNSIREQQGVDVGEDVVMDRAVETYNAAKLSELSEAGPDEVASWVADSLDGEDASKK